MTYTLTVVGQDNREFASVEDAISAGQASGEDVFAVSSVSDGLPTIHATGMLITYKQQNGRKGKMWNIAYI